MKTKNIIAILLIIISTTTVYSQDYKYEIGSRSGYPFGLTFKAYSSNEVATEFILSYRQGGFQSTILFEKYKPIDFRYSDNFFYYTGIGAHLGYTTKSKDHIFENYIIKQYPYEHQFRPVLGMDAIFGIEYRIYDFPLNISLDIKPYFDLFGQPFFDLSIWEVSLGISYKFN